ncbi:MAG: hypothetical protein ACFBSE_22015 [Prochloraceae cyanobacterium]
MPRPGGNPNIKKHGFTTDRVEPLNTQLALKVPASMKKRLKEKENWQEFVRNAISKALEEDDLQSA